MLKLILALALWSVPAAAADEVRMLEQGDWSKNVDGLRARLGLALGDPVEGVREVRAYLELGNVSNVASVMEIDLVPGRIQFAVADGRGHKRPPYAGPTLGGNELTVPLGTLRLPAKSTMRLDISRRSWIPKTKGATVLSFGIDQAWQLPPGDAPHFLRGTFTIDKVAHGKWHGTIELPAVAIPRA